MTIFVDADSCAREARLELQRIAHRVNVNLVFVANRNIPFDIKSPFFSMHVCETTKDAADDYIFEQVGAGDIVVTRDLLFAERLIRKDTIVVNDKGNRLTEKNIGYMLEERELSLQMKSLGISTGGKTRQYSQKDVSKLKETLSGILQ